MEDLVRLSVNIESFNYPDGYQALSNLKLEIRKGEFVGLLGANGSGKTTFLKVIDGLLKHFQGTVLLDGADITKLSPKEIYKKVGLIFQNPDDQLFAPTVFEDVAFGPINMGFDEKEVTRRVESALKAQNPPMPVGTMQLSVRPEIITSASPRSKILKASPMACEPEAQAVATQELGPFRPKVIPT